MTAGGLLELSRDCRLVDRTALRSAAKLKAKEELEALRLLKRVTILNEITLVTLEEIRSEVLGDSGFPPDMFNDDTILLAKRCAKVYGKLPLSVDRAIAHYESIDRQVPEEYFRDDMEKILRLVASYPSEVTVSKTGDGSLQVVPQEGEKFPTSPFSGLLPHGDISVLSADALSEVFEAASRETASETVPISQLLNISDIDKESLQACASAMFPKVAYPVDQLKSLFSSKRKKSPHRVQLQYLTRHALMHIGEKHYKVPSDASESLALAYAAHSIRKEKKGESADTRKRMRSSNSETGETGHVEQSNSVGSSGTGTELQEQGPTSVAEVLKNMPGTSEKRERVKKLLSKKALERPIEQDKIALRGLECLVQDHIYIIEAVLSVPVESLVPFLRGKAAE